MKLRILGCSGGIGGRHLRTTSFLVDGDVLIDAGTGVGDLTMAELSQIEAFDEETAQELQNRAIEFIEARNKEMDDKRKALGVEDQVLEVEGVTPAIAVALGQAEIKSLEDLAGAMFHDGEEA